jgi:hypothetical protein
MDDNLPTASVWATTLQVQARIYSYTSTTLGGHR